MSNILSLFWLVFPVIVWYNFIGKDVLSAMTWEMVVTIVLAVIGLIGSIIISTYKESKETRDAKDKILDKQNDNHNRLLQQQNNNHNNLSQQHGEIRQLITEKYSMLNGTIMNNQNKIIEFLNIETAKKEITERCFSDEQKDIKRKVEEINDFLNDWQRLVIKCAELQAENSTLRHENEMLCERLAEYENDEQPQP